MGEIVRVLKAIKYVVKHIKKHVVIDETWKNTKNI